MINIIILITIVIHIVTLSLCDVNARRWHDSPAARQRCRRWRSSARKLVLRKVLPALLEVDVIHHFLPGKDATKIHDNPWKSLKIHDLLGENACFFGAKRLFFGLETCFFVQETMWASMFFIGRKTIVCFEEEMWNDGLKRTGGFVMGFF